MDTPHAAFFDFHHTVQSVSSLPDAVQVRTLKFELFHALERAHDFQVRSRELEQQLDLFKIEQGERLREHQAFAAHASRELAAAKALCQSLLLTLERAADFDTLADFVPESATPVARAS